MLEQIKQYLSKRYRAEELISLDDNTLEKLYLTSENIVKMFYVLTDVDQSVLTQVYGEQMIFLYNNDTDLDKFYEYQALSQFQIAGAISGTVTDEIGALLSKLSKAILDANGVPKIQEDVDSDYYQTFGSV